MPEIERPGEEDDLIGEAELAAAAFVSPRRAPEPHGLRVGEACSADIENPASSEATEACTSSGKGNKPALIPLVPRTARTIDLAIGERTTGPKLLRHDGSRHDRRTAHRCV